MVEHAKGVRGFFEHLPGHRNRIAQLFEVQGRDALRRGQSNHLIIDQTKKVFDRLQLALNQLHGSFEIVEGRDASLEYLGIRLLNALLSIVGRSLNGMFSLLQLVLDGLAIGRSQVVLAAAINIKQVDKIFPTLIQGKQVGGNLLAGGELLIVGIDLVFHPAQILHRLALAWIETLDKCFALSFAEFARALLFATLYQAAINRAGGNDCQVDRFSSEGEQERGHIVKEGSPYGKAGHAPEVNRLLERLFYVADFDLGKFHAAV